MYYSSWTRQRTLAVHERMLSLGLESPYDEKWFSRPGQDHRITTQIEIGDYYDVRVNALLAHATQIDPTSKFWFGLPHDEARTVHPFEDYILVRSFVPELADETQREPVTAGDAPAIIETDLFAGLRARDPNDPGRRDKLVRPDDIGRPDELGRTT